MKADAKVFVAGPRGLVGSAMVRKLRAEGFTNLLLPAREELDLADQAAVSRYFESKRPAFVFLVAGKVGGFLANSLYPADFIRENVMIQSNVIDAAHRYEVIKLLDLGSSCIYPKLVPQPMNEDCRLTSSLEPTNEW